MSHSSERNSTNYNYSFKGKIWRKGKFKTSEFFIENGKIKESKKSKSRKASYIIPPFSDPHIHGGWGLSFQDGNFNQLEKKLLKEGIQFAIPTLENDNLEHIKEIAAAFRKYKTEKPNSIFPFLRMEGPFISEKKKGAQRDSFILVPNKENINRFLSIN